MRYQALNNFTKHYIEQAFQLGFSPQDIIDAFENQINLFDENAEPDSFNTARLLSIMTRPNIAIKESGH